MASMFASLLPPLPLVLWETPPALERILAQEGVPFRKVRDAHPLALAVGRFVLFDGRRAGASRVRSALTADHTAIDIDVLRREAGCDPFHELLDHRAAHVGFEVDGHTLVERVSRFPKHQIRQRLIARIREAVTRAGGVWARLAWYPFPYRSAFNLRADLDEHAPVDYARYARARRPLNDCTTHFVSTRAYHPESPVLLDLLGLDTQSHGHHHVVYRDEAENRRNLERAHELLGQAGITPVGFAAPEGRWNAGLDRVLEALGYTYSSDFHVGYDDLPFYPWRDGRFSNVLQVPVHPLCDGLFLEAGATGAELARHMVDVVRRKIAAGEPAFVYGHPERRLGRHPEVIRALAEEAGSHALLWRVTLTEFAWWWRWRLQRSWSLVPRGENRFEVQLDDWDGEYPLGLEVLRGSHSALVPLTGPCTPLRLAELAYEKRTWRADLPEPVPIRRPRGLKAVVRTALDWETVTPLEELPAGTVTARLKKHLRQWRSRRHRQPHPGAVLRP